MSSRLQEIIVDDRDERLVYTGDWSQVSDLGSFQAYNTTMTTPLTSGTDVSFTFNGTSVSVYGTMGKGSDGTLGEIRLDSNSTQVTFQEPLSNISFPGYHSRLFSAQNLPDGTHTVQVILFQLSSLTTPKSPNWFIDYITYVPSANAPLSLAEGESFFFDDTDPAFVYSGPWSTGDGAPGDMLGTLHGAPSPSSSVSLQFTGTYVNVYGRLPITSKLAAVAQFTIDGAGPFISNYPNTNNIASDPETSTSSNYRLYHNSSLTPGSHLLVITPLADQALWLDYVTAGTGTDLSNAGNSAPPPPPLPPSSSLTPNASGMPSRATPSPPPKPHPSTGVIAGAFVGAIACIALIAIFAYLYLRRRRRYEGKAVDYPYGDGHSAKNATNVLYPRPYEIKFDIPAISNDLESANNTRREKAAPSEAGSTTRTIATSFTATSSAVTSSAVTSSVGTSSVYSPSVASTSRIPDSINSLSVSPRQHQDSGLRGLLGADSVTSSEELPPVYSAI